MLKKVLTIAAAISLMSASAYALTIDTVNGTSIGGGLFKPSTNVAVVLFTDGTSGKYDGTVYTAGSSNAKGSKEFGAKNSDPKIYWKKTTTPGASSVSNTSWTPDTSWTSQ